MDPVGQRGSLAVTIRVTAPAKKDGVRDSFVDLDGPRPKGRTGTEPTGCICGTNTAASPALMLAAIMALLWLRRRRP